LGAIKLNGVNRSCIEKRIKPAEPIQSFSSDLSRVDE
jgi:hypothetical protein